ncbi:tripartite tricarboxylate transporter permease [Saliphagus sp. GCM10025334]
MVDINLLIAVLENVLTAKVLLLILLGVTYGIIFGVIPGLGPPLAIALLIPITIGLDPVAGLALLGAAYIAAVYGGAISAILLNTPGEPTSVATTFDGYPLARQGKAHIALGVSLLSSFVGGVISLIALVLLAPLLADVAIQFGAAEYFAIGVFGLVVIAAVSRGALLKGGIASVLGLLLGFVGFSPTTGVSRFTFDISYLSSGLSLVPIVVGLFAISEAIMLVDQGGTITSDSDDVAASNGGETPSGEISVPTGSLVEGIREAAKRPGSMLRSSLIGVGFGIIPGVGAAIANFVAYFDLQSSSKESDKFGKGAIDGVIGPEASNNAVTAAALIPTLVLAIPGNVATTLLLGALVFYDIRIGPLLFAETPELAYSFFAAILIANVAMFVIGYFVSSRLIPLTKLPVEIIGPGVIIMSIIGTFALNFQMLDSVLALIVGTLTVMLRKLEFPPVNIVFGLILAPILETNYQRALQLSGGEYGIFLDPGPLTLFALSAIVIGYNLVKAITGVQIMDRVVKR